MTAIDHEQLKSKASATRSRVKSGGALVEIDLFVRDRARHLWLAVVDRVVRYGVANMELTAIRGQPRGSVSGYLPGSSPRSGTKGGII